MLDGLTNLRFEILGEIEHGSFTIARLAEILRPMLEIIVGGAAAIGIATFASHLDEGSVNEALGIIEQQVKPAAQFAFARRERGSAGPRHSGLID